MTIDWAAFTPYSALVGGVLIGMAAAMLIVGIGRVAGISGVVGGLFSGGYRESWRWYFIAGLMLSSWIYRLFAHLPVVEISQNLVVLIIGGLLVGVGTRLGSGCTSGHGVCGLSALSVRSLVATLSFMAAGFFTVYIVKHSLAGA